MSTHGCRVVVPILALSAVAGCGDDLTGGEFRDGVWGGDHVRMSVDAREATLEYDCAHGVMELPTDLPADGLFVATGTHTRETGGPVRLDDPPDIHPARYDGQIVSNRMTLTVTLTDLAEVLGPFVLTRGSAGQVFKCL